MKAPESLLSALNRPYAAGHVMHQSAVRVKLHGICTSAIMTVQVYRSSEDTAPPNDMRDARVCQYHIGAPHRRPCFYGSNFRGCDIEARKKMVQHNHCILVVALTLPDTLSICLQACQILSIYHPSGIKCYFIGLVFPHQGSTTCTLSAESLVGNAEHRRT